MNPKHPIYDYVVFITRAQPFHNGHLENVKTALQYGRKVIIVLGSSANPRSPKNPFTVTERFTMVKKAIQQDLPKQQDNVIICGVSDHSYNDQAWFAQVARQVETQMLQDVNNGGFHTHGIGDKSVAILGYVKDETSFYIKSFPQWTVIEVPRQHSVLNATDIRHEYLQKFFRIPTTDHVPHAIRVFMQEFAKTEEFKWLVEEHAYYTHYKEIWKDAPYPVIITCVDAVCIQSGHILLVERKDVPGKGLLALPGGHVEPGEYFLDAAVRELKEETRIADDKGEIPPAMLKSFIDKSKTRLFDDPKRSLRGRVITQAYLFNLPNRDKLFTVRGDDDAASAKWYKLGDLQQTNFFEDHFFIIREMTGAV